jgi:ribosome-binding protein aMBF1 (putative translation factor)
MAYALGKYSQAECDRCGFVYKYLEMKIEWNGLKVCPECYESKQPQLEPVRVPVDPEALRQPRPTEPAPTTGYGIVKSGNTKNADGVSSVSMDIAHNDIIGSSFYMKEVTGSLGTVTVNIG